MNRPDVAILAAAFDSDPVFTLLFPDERPAALTAWFGTVLEVIGGCERGEVRAGADAVAIWTTGGCGPCLERLDDELTDLVRARAGTPAIDLIARVQAAAVPVEVPAWSLHWLGVDPRAQGHGHASALLSDLVASAHAAGAALATTTPNPEAVPFYEGHGLAQVGVRDVVGCPGLRFWTLLAPVPT